MPSFLRTLLLSRPQKRQTSGFTLIELLVIIVIVGILSAIAGPSWLSWRNNQWLGNARGQMAEAIRKAQSEAKLKKVGYSVVFDNGRDPLFGNSGRPRYAIVPTSTAPDQISSWTPIGGGNIPSSGISLRTSRITVTRTDAAGASTSTLEPRLVFDTYGTLALTDRSARADNSELFVAQISIGRNTDPQRSARRCVIVTSLLGSMRDAESRNCTLPN
jgi:prepilin-type N-terminal cleavage/methylation domain-containing protein